MVLSSWKSPSIQSFVHRSIWLSNNNGTVETGMRVSLGMHCLLLESHVVPLPSSSRASSVFIAKLWAKKRLHKDDPHHLWTCSFNHEGSFVWSWPLNCTGTSIAANKATLTRMDSTRLDKNIRYMIRTSKNLGQMSAPHSGLMALS
jgi:hypothetical protein